MTLKVFLILMKDVFVLFLLNQGKTVIFKQASQSHLLVFTHLWLNGSEAEQSTFIVMIITSHLYF